MRAAIWSLMAGSSGALPAAIISSASCLAVAVPIDEVVDQFHPDGPAPHRSVALPIAVDGGAIAFEGFAFVALPGREPGELQVDDAAAGFSLPKSGEVGGRLLGAARSGERLGQVNLDASLPGRVGQRGAQILHCLSGIATVQCGLAARKPALGQPPAKVGKGAEEKYGRGEENQRDGQQSQQRDGVSDHQLALLGALVGGESGLRVQRLHLFHFNCVCEARLQRFCLCQAMRVANVPILRSPGARMRVRIRSKSLSGVCLT